MISTDTEQIQVTLRIHSLQHFGCERNQNVQATLLVNSTQDVGFERHRKNIQVTLRIDRLQHFGFNRNENVQVILNGGRYFFGVEPARQKNTLALQKNTLAGSFFGVLVHAEKRPLRAKKYPTPPAP